MRSKALHRSTRQAGRARSVRTASAHDGFTLIEVVIALSVLVVAASIFYQMLLGTSRLRQTNHQNAVAADSARVVLEEMRNVPFLEIYERYNEDPADDPAGAGTAPGNLFDVAGLEPLAGAPGGKTGTITFPSLFVQGTPGGVGGTRPSRSASPVRQSRRRSSSTPTTGSASTPAVATTAV